ncbi:MAG: DNA repair protein RadA [Thermodesulfobacteriota bacterium]
MAKEKHIYRCTACGWTSGKWAGQCGGCGAWDSLAEQQPEEPRPQGRFSGYAGKLAPVRSMAEVGHEDAPRFSTGLGELDRVLGGGLVPGSVVLIGGDPGVGKSTALLQVCCNLSQSRKVLYVTGEESPQQIAMRARRLGLPEDGVLLMAETLVEDICATVAKEQPQVVVIDSIQTMQVAESSSAPGSVTQVRESAALLTRHAKESGTTILLVGHVTKSGDLAGPRVLEHIIDVVCYFEGGGDSRYRMMRAVKNRYGAVNELGVFAMTERGLKEIRNPSAIFLSRHGEPMPGSVVTAIWEGSRPLLVEMQALVDESHGENPRRVTVGLEQNRLAMLLAVLHRHGRVSTWNQDVFLNVVGGVRVGETGADLPLLLAVASSLSNRPLAPGLLVFGEVGLSGEIRPVPCGQERLREAAKHGFTRAIVPKDNLAKEKIPGMELIGVDRLASALDAAL